MKWFICVILRVLDEVVNLSGTLKVHEAVSLNGTLTT